MDKRKAQPAIVIGLTGGFGTGKSTVAKMMLQQGAAVIDADEIVHQIMKPGTEVYASLVSYYGPEILKKNGQIDRVLLAKIVFAPCAQHKLDYLCSIIHPPVIKIIEQKLRYLKAKGSCKFVVIDAPLLLETGLEKKVDKVVVVKASLHHQIKRCQAQYGLGKEQILARIKYQMPLEEKIKRADFVIDNNGSLASTQRQVKQIMSRILS